MLKYQERRKKKKGRSNVETILNVKSTPGNNRIARLLDVAPWAFAEVFASGLEIARRYTGLNRQVALNNAGWRALTGCGFINQGIFIARIVHARRHAMGRRCIVMTWRRWLFRG
ncbi:MAG: hypothetical protein LBK73_00680 [Treponema sp.]|jgi:hypothetical protein|nr:hypothetical protein [Treponema sp.]